MDKRKRIPYHLNAESVESLPMQEIIWILRGADEMIGVGGRSLLCKLLKGSNSKVIFDHKLNLSPVFGVFHNLTIEEIMHRVDKTIYLGYLKLEYRGKLPVFSFTESGWEIERETMVNELYKTISECVQRNEITYCEKLKDRNRGMILALNDKLRREADASFSSFLEAWKVIEYRNVRDEIGVTLEIINERGKSDETS